MKQAHLIIYSSPNGRTDWHPVESHALPGWVKDPDVMGRLVAGEECMKADEGDKGSNWYRAVKVLSPADHTCVQAAKKKRARRAAVH